MDDWNRFGNSESDERGFIMTDPKPQAENTARTIYDADDQKQVMKEVCKHYKRKV